MSTRFTHLASRQTKQKLVKLLFGHKYAGKGPEAHRKLDGASYSYSQLRNAYLQRIQEIHPDKFKANAKSNNRAISSNHNEKNDYFAFDELHHQFVNLQEAWDQYEAVIRVMKRAGKTIDDDANFTMFGVGCSFADNDKERDLRNEITDQACRGWFSSGELPERATSEESSRTQTSISLCDDDMFVSSVETEASNSSKKKGRRRSLVDGEMGWRKGSSR